MHVGLAGIGKMGAAIGFRLLSLGYSVTVWNRTAERAQPLVDAGAQWAQSPRALAESVDVVIDQQDLMKDRMGLIAQAQDQKGFGLETQPKTPASARGVQVGERELGFH